MNGRRPGRRRSGPSVSRRITIQPGRGIYEQMQDRGNVVEYSPSTFSLERLREAFFQAAYFQGQAYFASSQEIVDDFGNPMSRTHDYIGGIWIKKLEYIE